MREVRNSGIRPVVILGTIVAGLCVEHSSAAPTVVMENCQKFVARYRGLATDHPGEAPLNVFARLPSAGIRVGSALGQAQNKSENPSSTQNRGLKRGISKEFGQVLQSAGIDAATSDIRRLPTTDIYAVGGGCQIPAYFKVINGHASPEAAPQGFEEAEGMRCGDSPTFVGSVDGTPVVFQQHYDWGSAMDAQVLVATWRGDRLAGTCQVTLSYAPLFWTKTFNDWGERCNSAACEEFRAAAFKLVEAVQNSPRHALAAQLASLSSEQLAAYDSASKASSGDSTTTVTVDTTSDDP